jgi:riboflavin synthase
VFTGLAEAIGEVIQITDLGDRRMVFRVPAAFLLGCKNGDSISVSGVCLTAIELQADCFTTDVSLESLSLTSLAGAKLGTRVNLERALLPTSRMGGHFVSGHVDGLGVVVAKFPQARAEQWEFSAPKQLLRMIAVKGSICVDGVSLTVNTLTNSGFTVMLIPHTLSHTTLQDRQPGDSVNLEVDLIARYLARFAEFDQLEKDSIAVEKVR